MTDGMDHWTLYARRPPSPPQSPPQSPPRTSAEWSRDGTALEPARPTERGSAAQLALACTTPTRHERGLQRSPLLSRRRLQIALGLFWLLDGALQLQPFMFSKGFAQKVIAPAAIGQPTFVAAAVHVSASMIGGHPVFFDAAFATVQLVIGAGLLFTRTVRMALVASVAWALGVWVFGEGLGGLGSGATFLVGAPGAVILYAVIGLAAWPRLERSRPDLDSNRAHLRRRLARWGERAHDEPPARWVSAAWTITWLLFAALQALPENTDARSLKEQVTANAANAPAWLAHAEHAIGVALGHQDTVAATALVVAEVAIGLLALRRGAPRRLAVVTGIALALAVWVFGQAFGQIPTGMGTDPNSGPLVALLGLAVLARAGRPWVGTPAQDRRRVPRPVRTNACGPDRRLDVA